MYQAFICFAFLAFCSAAPYGDISSTRTLPAPLPQQYGQQQPMPTIVEKRDETDLVDSQGSGYAFFRYQDTLSRPIEQQRVAVRELDNDNSNQYSDYARSSALKTLPASNGYGGTTKVLLSRDQGPYGSALSPVEPDTRVLVNSGYGSQVHTDDRVLVSGGYGGEQKVFHPHTKVVNTGYGQPQVEEKTFISIKSNNGYGSQIQPDNRVLVSGGYGSQVQPDNRVLVSGGYGSQVQTDDRVLVSGGYGGERKVHHPHVKIVNTGYGQPQVEEKTVITIKSNNGYGSQVQPDTRVLSSGGYGSQVQPDTRVLSSGGYGSQVQPDTRVLSSGGYGSQVQPDSRVLSSGGYRSQVQPDTRVLSSGGYGSQVQPDTRVLSSGGYGSQVQPDTRVLPSGGYGSQVQPDSRVLSSGGYGSQVQPDTRVLPSGGYGSQVQPDTRVLSSGGYGSQVQPDNRVLVRGGYGEQRFI
jgi:hypothetical protein